MTTFNNASPGKRSHHPAPRTTVDYEDPAWDYGNPFGDDPTPREQIRHSDVAGTGAVDSPTSRAR